MNIVTEIVEFELSKNMTAENFIRIVDSLEKNFHSLQPGFIDTELVKGKEEGQWLMIQHWQSMEDAKQVVKQMMKVPITEEFRNSINPKTVKMALLHQFGRWA